MGGILDCRLRDTLLSVRALVHILEGTDVNYLTNALADTGTLLAASQRNILASPPCLQFSTHGSFKKVKHSFRNVKETLQHLFT